jgi:hypothetical protein
MLGDVDEVQTLQKIQKIVDLIYQYFKSQLNRPPNDTEL